ncbi:hypothetical protein EA004_20315 [Vibrio anguillarum]|uniref:Uncharacterized protein n=2 Tax=Vibrio anguillarum TaxID=55601 RepID=A0ABR9ZA06_VIBAN|nr:MULTISPECIES: hypothetical protein [Vibrio]MBF4247307.1 hypothetical protein [Vibrio anguillarum]MBF4375266.1 hypothetical protein [Vibrio anguillarum]OXX29857.1 hypothetical protein B9J95_12590 [Vibrio sp. V14_P6S14T42]OXX33921.1 hypothetical protein B9J81_09895 [Vibrio sp. V04_P4A5T148]
MKKLFLYVMVFFSGFAFANDTKAGLTLRYVSYIECADYYFGLKDEGRANLMLMGMNTMLHTLSTIYEQNTVLNFIEHAVKVVAVGRKTNNSNTFFASQDALDTVCDKLVKDSNVVSLEVFSVMINKPNIGIN